MRTKARKLLYAGIAFLLLFAVLYTKDEVTLAGSFCIGKCNRVGVTIQVDDEVYTGVTPMGFDEFFREHILSKQKL